MKASETYIVSVNSRWQILYKCPLTSVKDTDKAVWFITTNGAFGQRDTYVEQIPKKQAIKLIENMQQSVPTEI